MGASPAGLRIFIGTYTKGTSKGVYTAVLDPGTGSLSGPELAAAAPNPTFLALAPGGKHLYAVCAGSWASSFAVAISGKLSPVQQAEAGSGPTPCHIAVSADGKVALAANYHLAEAAAIPLEPDGTFGKPRVIAHTGRGPHPTRQTSSHVHSTNFSPDGRFALVCDLGLDRIYTYQIDPEHVALLPGTPPFVATAPAAGPRHLSFGREGRHAYVVNEIEGSVAVYDYAAANGELTYRQTVTLLSSGGWGDSVGAEVRVHPNGRFVYASARGPDTVSVFAADPATGELTLVESVPCGGKGPRCFTLSPDGQWLVCAHQNSDTLCSFRVDAVSGRLTRVPGTIAVSMPVCVAFAS
jgi:6-phosphogluconolactonase